MCMGYAKDIAAWACQAEASRRDAALQAWGETWVELGMEMVALIDPSVGGPQPDPQQGRLRHVSDLPTAQPL
ncbi:hypothetical protein SAMN05421875_12540 [Acidovorax soli]|uniref:Uncharacterized protein n=1 Tax=Acidovorax soli TaxID=592050 RepID=A0A1H4DJP2_9BURK|nr:hypothetical protein SAMN05421875_12540 [Acidovorax soli]